MGGKRKTRFKRQVLALFLALCPFLCSCARAGVGWEECTIRRETDGLSAMVLFPCLLPADRWERANRTLLSYAACDLPAVAESGGSITGDYQVFREREGMVSVQFQSDYYVLGRPHPTVARRAVTFRLADQRRVRLADLVRIDGAFLEQVRMAARSHPQKEIKEYFSNLSETDWMQFLSQCDRDEFSPAYSIPTAFGVRLLLSAPHPLGDAVELEVPLPETKDLSKS